MEQRACQDWGTAAKKAGHHLHAHFTESKTKGLPRHQGLCALCTAPLFSKDQKAWLAGETSWGKVLKVRSSVENTLSVCRGRGWTKIDLGPQGRLAQRPSQTGEEAPSPGKAGSHVLSGFCLDSTGSSAQQVLKAPAWGWSQVVALSKERIGRSPGPALGPRARVGIRERAKDG